MFKFGVNAAGVDYNRNTVYVHHVMNDVTGRFIPLCGSDIYSLTDAGDAEPTLLSLKAGRDPFGRDTSSRMCGRCVRSYLSRGSDEEKANRRLARAAGKKLVRRRLRILKTELSQNGLTNVHGVRIRLW